MAKNVQMHMLISNPVEKNLQNDYGNNIYTVSDSLCPSDT